MKALGVIGEGAWGSALANLCADNGFTVYLWCHDPIVKQLILNHRSNPRYLSGAAMHQSIIPTTELCDLFSQSTWIIEAIPVRYLRSVLEECKQYASYEHRWVITSKGIENDTLQFPADIIDDVLGYAAKKMVLVGPSFAKEVVQKLITAVSIAAPTLEEGVELQRMLANRYFRPYVHTDLIGAQVGAAVKNVIALGIGMLDGAGYADNTKAFFLTRGLYEAMQLSVMLGGKAETIYGLSGVGDTVLTGMSSSSRNREVGEAIGKGNKLEDILRKTGYTPEGVNSAQSFFQLMQKYELDVPVCRGVYQVLYEGKTIKQVIEAMMSRSLEREYTI